MAPFPTITVPLILSMDSQILLNREQKQRLLALFDRAKQCLPRPTLFDLYLAVADEGKKDRTVS